jgi:hypothetical protein
LENLRKGIGDDVLRTRHVVDDPVRYRTQAVFSKQDLVLAASTEIHVLSVDQIVDRCRPLPLIMPLDLEKIASRSLQFAFLNPSTRSSIGAATLKPSPRQNHAYCVPRIRQVPRFARRASMKCQAPAGTLTSCHEFVMAQIETFFNG